MLLPLGAMLMSMTGDLTGEHVGICGLWCCSKPCWGTSSVLLKETMGNFISCAAAGCYQQQTVFGSDIIDCRLITKTLKATVATPLPPQKRKKKRNSSEEGCHWRELLKFLWRCWTAALYTSKQYMGNTNWTLDLMYFFFYFQGGSKNERGEQRQAGPPEVGRPGSGSLYRQAGPAGSG